MSPHACRAGDISDLLAQLWDVKFTVFSPTYANRKLSGGSLMDKLMTVIATSDSEMLSSAGVSVAGKSPSSLLLLLLLLSSVILNFVSNVLFQFILGRYFHGYLNLVNRIKPVPISITFHQRAGNISCC